MTTYDVSTGKEIFLAEIAKELSGTDLERAIAALPEEERKNYDRFRRDYERRDPLGDLSAQLETCHQMAEAMRHRRQRLLDEADQEMKLAEELSALHENCLLAGENQEASSIWKRVKELKASARDKLEQTSLTADLDRLGLYERVRSDPFSALHQKAMDLQDKGVAVIEELEIEFRIALSEAFEARRAFLNTLHRAGQARNRAAKAATITSRCQHYLKPEERAHLGAGTFVLPKPEAWPVTDYDIQRYFGYTWGVWPDSRMVADREAELASQQWSRLVDQRNRALIEGKHFDKALDRRLERLHRIAFGG